MTTTKHIIILLLLTLTACGQNSKTNKHVIDPKARQLNDSAVALTRSFDSLDYVKAIALLDKATTIDTNFYTAYWNKLAFQSQLGQYNNALQTAKQLKRIKPNAPDFYVTTGMLYEKTGDSISAQSQYKEALIRYDKILDTMDIKNKDYDMLLMNKGVSLILVGQQTKGNDIIKKLYDKQTDVAYKEMFEMFLNKSRQEILDNYKTRN
jgi:tetratricopeptide (TPR) repeat protein